MQKTQIQQLQHNQCSEFNKQNHVLFKGINLVFRLWLDLIIFVIRVRAKHIQV